jgi:hypothetical protein
MIKFKEMCDRIGFEKNIKADIISAFKQIKEKQQALDLLYLASSESLNDNIDKDKLYKIEKLTGIHPYTVHAVVVVYSVITTEENCKQKGMPSEMFDWILYDIKCKADETKTVHGISGIEFFGWFNAMLSLKRLCFGRLQYEIIPAKYDFGEFKKGDSILNFHIPSGLPLTEDSVIDSFKKAHAFYDDLKKNSVLPLTCNSWLLHPATVEHCFKEGSNLRKFYDMFTIMGMDVDDKNSNFWRVCGCNMDKFDTAPEETSLQRNLKNMIRSGVNMGHGFGYILFDGEKIVK